MAFVLWSPKCCSEPRRSSNLRLGIENGAAFGVSLQIGVAVFAGITAVLSHRPQRFMNDGALVQVYPFPAMALSTMAFAVRILGCSYIIDGSTTEEV